MGACYSCHGTGNLVTTSQCPACGGRGYAEQWKQPLNPNQYAWSAPGNVRCSQCDGRGSIQETRFGQCPGCNGRAWIDDDSSKDAGIGRTDFTTTYYQPIHVNDPAERPAATAGEVALGGLIWLILLAGGLIWWNGNWFAEQISSIPPRAKFYLLLGGLWSGLMVVLIPLTAPLYAFSRNGHLTTATLGWTIVALLAAVITAAGASSMLPFYWGLPSNIVVAMLGGILTIAAGACALSPRLFHGGFSFWFMGIVGLALMVAVNTVVPPVPSASLCMDIQDVRAWMVTESLVESSKSGGGCQGLRLSPMIATPRVNVSESQAITKRLRLHYATPVSYDRSMAVLWSSLALSISIAALLYVVTFRIWWWGKSLPVLQRWSSSVHPYEEETTPPILLSILTGTALLIVVVVLIAQAQTPAVPLNVHNIRPFFISTVTAKLSSAVDSIDRLAGHPGSEKTVKWMRQR